LVESEIAFQRSKGGPQWQVVNECTLTDRTGREKFHFDRVFKPEISTDSIFHKDIQPMIFDALKGYNVTILAYGQTSSGKTHTISGTDEFPGLIVLTAKSLFKSLNYLVTPEGITAMPAPHNHEVNFTDRRTQVTISFLEIYNESVNDLLNCAKRNLEVRENRNGDVIVDGLTNKVVTCEEEFLTCMREGDAIRMSAETRANIHSSRSHTVFRIQVEIVDINTETGRRSI
jgi:centromeric protein E